MLAGGDAIVLGFLYPGLVYLLFAVGYTTIARHVPGGGAFLTYIAAGLGARTGSVAGMIAYVGYLGGQIGFTASASVFASFTIETLTGIRLHWPPIAVVITVLVLTLGLRRVGVGRPPWPCSSSPNARSSPSSPSPSSSRAGTKGSFLRPSLPRSG